MSEIPERADFGSFIPEGRRALWGIGEYVFNTAISRVTTVEQAQAAAGAILANIERDGVTGGGWYIPNAVEVRGEPEPTGDILDSIDNALGCQRCGRPLGASPSDDFCSPGCLRAWHAQHALPLDPNSPDAARVYVGQDGRAVPLDEGGPEEPWPSSALQAEVAEVERLGEALIHPHGVRVRVEHSRDDSSDHTDIVGDPWRPFDLPAGVDWERAVIAALDRIPQQYQIGRESEVVVLEAASEVLDAFQARQVTVEVNEHTNTAVVHVERNESSPSGLRRVWNLITGERHG